ncbi:MAG: hypothetical protein ACD_79C01330G0001 [uncultured bacterium]|nr:MAG: hypothetical protein ACD_79C01330G0001 [uncultured bacterium]
MNVLKAHKKSAVITLISNGISQMEISRKTRVDCKTIRKYGRLYESGKLGDEYYSKSPGVATGSGAILDSNSLPRPPVLKAISAQSACETHRKWIEAQVHLSRNAMSIYQDLVECFAFEHKYNSVKRFVKRLKKKSPEQYDLLEFLPGEEAQVDYGMGAPALKPGTDKYHRPRLFVMTLRYSRRSFRKVVWKSSQEVWARLHEEAFRYFGGVPKYVVLDNLKEGVIKPDIYEPELNSLYSALLSFYGAVADPARVRDPNRKGSVENAIQHTQNTALKGRKFESLEKQNEWLMQWEERWAAPRIHGRAKRQVQEMYLEEKPYLKQLPLDKFSFYSEETRTVQDDGTIQVKDCYYAALPLTLGTQALVRIYDNEIVIINPETLKVERRHPKGKRKGMVFLEDKDRIFNPSRQTHYLFERAERIGPNTKRFCEEIFREQGRTGQRRMQGIVNLGRKFRILHIEAAAKISLEKNISKYQIFKKLVEDISRAKQSEEDAKTEGIIQYHPLIRPSSEYSLFFETHAAINES